MTREELIDLRKRLGWTQARMAEAIGMALRAYSDIENGNSNLRETHALAAERAAIGEAAVRGDQNLLTPRARTDVLAGRALVIAHFLARWVDQLEEMRKNLEPLESGKMHVGHRGPGTNFEWKDTTAEMIAEKKRYIAELEELIEQFTVPQVDG